MQHGLICWKCGASLEALTLPFGRLDVCKACGAELHVCKFCVDYDTSKAKHCREPIAEEVRDKEHANFCDYYKPRANAWQPPDQKERDQSRSGLESLFGAKAPAPPSGDAARTAADSLFRKK